MLTVGFLVPLGISVKSQAKLRGVATAQSDARGVATAVAAVTPHFSSSCLERFQRWNLFLTLTEPTNW